MRSQALRQLMAVAAITMATNHVEIPRSMRATTPAKPRTRKWPTRDDSQQRRAIAEWNAAVEQRKAEKRARKEARSKT